MTSEIDIYRSAHTLIEQHGEGAAIQAAMEADAMLRKNSSPGMLSRAESMLSVMMTP